MKRKTKNRASQHKQNRSTSGQEKKRANIILVEKANFSNFFSLSIRWAYAKLCGTSRSVFSAFFFYTLFQHCLFCVCAIFCLFSISCPFSLSLIVVHIAIQVVCFQWYKTGTFFVHFFTIYFYPVVALLFNIILKFDVHFQIDNCRSKYLGLGTVNIAAGSVQSCFVYKKLIKVLWKTWSKMILTWPNKRKKNLNSYE